MIKRGLLQRGYAATCPNARPQSHVHDNKPRIAHKPPNNAATDTRTEARI
jgi:hypothetical protein